MVKGGFCSHKTKLPGLKTLVKERKIQGGGGRKNRGKKNGGGGRKGRKNRDDQTCFNNMEDKVT